MWLKQYCSVSNMDSSKWLTVRGGVSPSPIIPSSSFEPRWRFYVCVCVEKAARRAVCQLSAHVVNIRNQTGANRMQVKLGIAFICLNNPQWCLIISHCYISKQLALFFFLGGGGDEDLTLALIVEEWEWTVLIIWLCWFEHGDKCLAYRCSCRVFPACLCEVLSLTVCVLSLPWVMARCPVDRKKVRRRQCLLLHRVAIATAHLFAAILTLITTQHATTTPTPRFCDVF